MEIIRKVRWAHFRDGTKIREIARNFNPPRNTVRSIIRSSIIDQKYERSEQPYPKLGSPIERLSGWLQEDADKPIRRSSSAQILFEQLQREGYEGGYDAVRRYVGTWKRENGTGSVNAFVPLEYAPGDASQFDWSYEQVELSGVPVKVRLPSSVYATAVNLFVLPTPVRQWRWFLMLISVLSSILAASADEGSTTT